MKECQKTNDPAKQPEPVTAALGSHPVGTGVGIAAGGVAGAVAGTVVGPAGTVVGAAIGAVAGGLIGTGVAQGVNPGLEHEYWRKNYVGRPYVAAGSSYDQYARAYQYGWEARQKHAGKNFDDVEAQLGRDWERAKGKSLLMWDSAKQASRDAWDRITGGARRS